MFETIELELKKLNIRSHKNRGITVCNVDSSKSGVDLAASLLYELVDRRAVLYLSGGSTPKTLYEKLSKEEVITPGAVGQIDERYGDPFHSRSNQLMIRETGFIRYLEILDIPFYPILEGKPREETADDYDQKFRELNAVFQKNIAILGVGSDGHTAGLPAQSHKSPVLDLKQDKFKLVTEYNDKKGVYKERVTMTFLGLEMQDVLLLLVFGDDKKEALEMMFEDGNEHEIPSRFYKRSDIAKKTLLITDQSV
jgi:6-phosphogluconolactonase/glucosamine-6-phosphate isomerase/deaminase